MKVDGVLMTTVVLVALTMAPAITHAFDFPGKKGLGREAYVTWLGASEPVSIAATILLLLRTVPGETDSGLR
jgi:hypothetical protein